MNAPLRELIAFEAARLLHSGQETDYPRAKRRAVRSIGYRFRPRELPSNREVRLQLRRIIEVEAAHIPDFQRRALLLEAARVMRRLKQFSPRLREPPGPEVARGVELRAEIHVLQADAGAIYCLLVDDRNLFQAPIPNDPGSRWDRQIRAARLPITVVCHAGANYPAGLMEASIDPPTLEARLASDTSTEQLESEIAGLDPTTDRFEVYRFLLEQLEEVRQDPRLHPEGDALFHSLQVFDLAHAEQPFDEEYLTAALLHDVGKAADPDDPVAAGLSLLEGIVTHRTSWFIESLPRVRQYARGELSPEERQRLEKSEDFENLARLRELDEIGRRPGARTRSADEAIAILRQLDHEGM